MILLQYFKIKIINKEMEYKDRFLLSLLQLTLSGFVSP